MPTASPTPTAGDDLQGRPYWRGLQQLADSPEVREQIAREFPDYDPDELLSLSRRKFMKLAGASMALAGLTLTGCRRWPMEKVVAHNARPEGIIPGVPETYASMLGRGGVAHGLFVTSFDGRPIHVAGSPLHPISGDPARYDGGKGRLKVGSADPYTLASILDLYDPDRSRSVIQRTGAGENRDAQRSDWDAFFAAMDLEGKRVAVLSEANLGPTFLDTKKRFLEKVPGATWNTWEPLHRDAEIEGTMRAFGRPVRPQFQLAEAQVLACFDSDLLSDHPAANKHARDWAKLRRSCDDQDNPRMSRVYATGPALTPTLSSADIHLQVKPAVVSVLLEALAREVGVAGLAGDVSLEEQQAKFVKALAKDLKAHQGRSLVTVGPTQPASVHALAWSINAKLGALGQTVSFTPEPLADDGMAVDGIRSLVQRMNGGEVDVLLILGGNPVYDAPVDLDFADALANVGTTVHLAQYDNETSRACDWHVNEAHYLEAWGDGRAWDGTICLQQPLILPLWNGKSAIEVLARLAGDEAVEGYDLVRRAWSAPLRAPQYDVASSAWVGGMTNTAPEKAWRTAVHDGLLPDTAWPAENVSANAAQNATVPVGHDAMQVVFRTDPKTYDGRYANNGWLQELPEPITKVAWDNPAWVSVTDAKDHGWKNGDVLKITVDGRSLEVAAMLTPGQAPGTVILTLGQGRTAAGRIGSRVGFNAYALRATGAQGAAYKAEVTKTGQTHALATTSEHHLIDPTKLENNGSGWVAEYGLNKRTGKKPGDEGYLIKQSSFDDYLKNPNFANDDAHADLKLQLYDAPLAEQFAERAERLKAEHPEAVEAGWEVVAQFNDRHAWGMTIDMTACTGCSACVVACQSENNIPVVGKDQVIMSREMQWLRVDSYFRGDPEQVSSDKLDAVHMPLTCVHCENAPCEQVCPVAATVHDTEGLNTMVYNRCIGTRYCSNNCPYKVRRFNYFDYHAKLETDDFRPNRRAGGIQNKPWLKMPDQQPNDVIDQVRRMVFNPDVTVRMRGVMEKCTYCTQRISRARIEAKARWAEAKAAGKTVEDYPYVEDGAVVTACQAACPTEAISFGNLNDPKSKVAQLQNLKKTPRAYGLLPELNTRPRTKHLGLVRNPGSKDEVKHG
jgi:molybdopterin-containing oxidoreductase family iron-sulfur binding subunit